MKLDTYLPTERLRPYVRCFVVSENEESRAYKVLPSSGLVMGFQYKGGLSVIQENRESKLSAAGITGISDRYKMFRNSAHTGTLLVYFTETGFTHFTALPAHELANLSLSLDTLFDKNRIGDMQEKLGRASTDAQRIALIEQFLLAHLRHLQPDRLISEAVRLIHQSHGAIRIGELIDTLSISQSPFEKRFRKVVGTSPKKFASLVRFQAVLDQLHSTRPLTDICYEANFFDQAHFIKDFRQLAGDTPEHFRLLL